MTPRERETFEAAEKRWGADSQIDMCIEECAELIVSLSHLRRDAHASSTDHQGQIVSVLEELADVSIVLDEVALILNLVPNVPEIRNTKVERLRQRLGMETT